MKVSELIKELQEVLDMYGDLKVKVIESDLEEHWFADVDEILVQTIATDSKYERTFVHLDT